MVAANFEFPDGDKVAITSSNRDFTFDDLHRLRLLIRRELARHWETRPQRILGCLDDDHEALFALLFLTEITDYMPINPKLSDVETSALLDSSGADLAVVSRGLLATQAPVVSSIPVLIWGDIIDAAVAGLAHDTEQTDPLNWKTKGRLILHTSGSTGTPKRVPITVNAMNASARNIAAGHDLKVDDHALNALPTFHIGALVDVMLAPFAAGGSISITDKRAPHDLVQSLIEQRPTWVQVVPTLLRRLVEDIPPSALTEAGRSLRFIRSISAPVPPDLKQQVEDLFGCPVVEMYGMTETAGQIATLARDPALFRPHSVGKPIGVEVAIMDRYGNMLRTGQTGEVCVKGPTVFGGYEGSVKDDVFFEDWFRTGDLGVMDQDGYVFLQGRLKEMVNVGGEKVSPHEVETAVLRMPEVIEAAAYSVPHPSLGEQVGLTIATKRDVSANAVKTFLEGELAGFKCPNTISIVDQLPRLANAKVDRILLKRTAHAEWQARQTATGSADIQHRTPEARAVALHWARILACRTPEGDDDFFDMGGDSLSATQLLVSLEKALKRQISPNQLFEAPTFSGLVSALSDHTPASDGQYPRSIRYIQEKTAGWPGQAVAANGLLRSLGSLKTGHPLFWSSQMHTEIDAILGTIGKARPLYVAGSLYRFKNRTEKDFKIVAEQLADEIMSIQPDGPIALGGFCGGAWVMHHTADLLRARGRDIRAFISFDYWPEQEVTFPVVQCLSLCAHNSARAHYARHELAESLLHRGGVLKLNVDSTHRFDAIDIAPHVSVLNDILNGTQQIPDALPIDPGKWALDQRLLAPQARIKFRGRPRFYQPNGRATFKIEVTNTSDMVWEPTEISGLSVQVDLINLDGHARTYNLAHGTFDHPIPPGGVTTHSVEVTFPDKRVPMWLSCSLTSQGLIRFSTRDAGRHRTVIFPNLIPRSTPNAPT